MLNFTNCWTQDDFNRVSAKIAALPTQDIGIVRVEVKRGPGTCPDGCCGHDWEARIITDSREEVQAWREANGCPNAHGLTLVNGQPVDADLMMATANSAEAAMNRLIWQARQMNGRGKRYTGRLRKAS